MMRRVVALSMVVALVVASVTVGVGVAAAGTGPTGGSGTVAAQTGTDTPTGNASETGQSDGEEANESAAAVAPGAQLAGVVAVQRAEIDGELATRTFEREVDSRRDADSKARVVARHVNQSQQRLDDLRSRLADLRAERRAGNLSQGRYRAQAAHLATEIRSLQRLLDQTQTVAVELPDQTRQANGIDEERFDRLRNDTRNLSGSEVSEIAREVAGDNFGNGLASDRRAERGPPTGTERGPPNASERGPPDGERTELPGNAPNATGRDEARNGTEFPGNAPNATPGRESGNESDLPGNATNATDRGEAGNRSGDAANGTDRPGASDDAPGRDRGNSVTTTGERPADDAPGNSGDAPGRENSADREPDDATEAGTDEADTEDATEAGTDEADTEVATEGATSTDDDSRRVA